MDAEIDHIFNRISDNNLISLHVHSGRYLHQNLKRRQFISFDELITIYRTINEPREALAADATDVISFYLNISFVKCRFIATFLTELIHYQKL